MFISICFTNS